MSLSNASLPPGLLSSPELLETLLDVSLTGVIFFQPVYAPDGSITDLAYVHLNSAARQMLQLPRRPAETFLTLYPNALETGIFAFYRDTFLSGKAARYDVNYSYDGLDNYFHLSAQRSGAVLVVSFTDTSHQPRTVVEQALRDSQARERGAREKAEAQQREIRQVFEQAPVAISICRGPGLVVEVANPSMLELWGKTSEQVLGKPLFDALPELQSQGFDGLFKGVMQTGTPVVAQEHPTTMLRHGKPETGYYNLIYQALRDEQGAITGVITVVTEVTPLVLARQQAEQSRRQVQDLNRELAAANEELKATNEETLAANEELLHTRRQLEQFNAQLEARVTSRTADLLAAQDEAERQRYQLHTLFEQAPVAIAILEGAGHVIRLANPTMQALWDKTAPQVLGKPLFEALPEAQPGLALVREVFETGQPFRGSEVPVHRPAGGAVKRQYLDLSYTPLTEAGRTTGVLFVALDVTQGVEARKKIEESEYRFRSLIEESPIATCLFTGRDLVIEVANEEMIGLWGKGLSVLGKPLREALPELEGQPFLHILDEVFNSGQTYEAHAAEVLLVKEGGLGVYYFDFTYKPLFNAQGEVYGILDAAVEVTEQVLARRKIEASARVANQLAGELAVANEELRAAHAEVLSTNGQLTRTNVDLDNFIYTASHDLKAPISNIESLLTALLRTLPPESLSSERTRRITAMMQDSVERFKKTIGNLTEIVKLQKENSQQATEVNLPEVIGEVLLDLEPAIRSSGARVEVDAGDCPAICFPEKNLRSVVYNLLSNAIKYRSPDRVPRVVISCRQTGAEQVLTVEDNGLGMEAGRMSQLFTMFKRFHDHVEGTGIGLYMVKKIVENAGGRIEAESRAGAGSTFRVYFRR